LGGKRAYKDSATRGFIPPLDKKEGGPKAALSPADLERDAHRGVAGKLSWLPATPLKVGPALQRIGCITMIR
jgi:hypothetical protein